MNFTQILSSNQPLNQNKQFSSVGFSSDLNDEIKTELIKEVNANLKPKHMNYSATLEKGELFVKSST